MGRRKLSNQGAYWVCGCPPETGEHIIEAQYSACVYCGARKSDCAEINVASGLGGVFEVQIIELGPEGCKVQVINSQHGFNDMKPYFVKPETIKRRVHKGAGA